MKTYKLLKFIEPKTSIPVGGTFKAGDLIRLANRNTIPADWLIEHWYIKEEEEEHRIEKVYNELWNIHVYYSLERFEEVIEKHMPAK